MLVAGVDEAGRGPLAGPVVAAAVILDPARPIAGLADSKQLTPGKRERLAEIIRSQALAWSLGRADVEEIDSLNILQATLLAMQRAWIAYRDTTCAFYWDKIQGTMAQPLASACEARETARRAVLLDFFSRL